MQKLLVSCVGIAFYSMIAYADPAQGLQSEAQEQQLIQDEPETKKIHLFVSGGWTSSSYSNSEIQHIVHTLEGLSSSKTSLGGDIGFYWSLSQKLLLGFDVAATLSTYSSIFMKRDFVQFPVSLSSIYSFGSKSGSGVFVRGDLGPTFFLYPTPLIGGYQSSDFTAGWGSALMLGYAFPITLRASLLLNSSVALRAASYEGFYTSENAFQTLTYAVSAGFLF